MTVAGLAPTRRHFDIGFSAWNVRFERRSALVVVVLLAIMVVLGAITMTVGDYPIAVARVPRLLWGDPTDPLGSFFVRDVRLPRLLAAVGVGVAFGASGAIFQSMTGNPLGSPDIIGFTTGAASGALLLIVAVGASPGQVSVGAISGGLASALVVYSLARRDGVSPTRLVLVGVGIASMLQAFNSLLIVRASLPAAQTAGVWLAGSLNATDWPKVRALLVSVGILFPAAVALLPALRAMTLGDDVASALGVGVERSRRRLVVVGVALVATGVAAAGPVAFVALSAPQLARRLTRTAGVGLGASAMMGAVLVVAADLVAQRAFAPTQLPVGVVTGALGGVYLVWLLAWRWRREHS